MVDTRRRSFLTPLESHNTENGGRRGGAKRGVGK